MTVLDAKRRAAERAAQYVRDGMRVGLGSGSTAELVIAELGRRVAAGLRFQAVPSSVRTREIATRAGITLVELDGVPRLDLAIDGADEVDPRFQMIKGHGGALVREKIIASAADTVVIVVDRTKLVDVLGAALVPVEVVRFGWRHTLDRIGALGVAATIRLVDGAPFVSDNDNHIIDCRCPGLADAGAWHERIKGLTGVVETGIFVDALDVLIVGADAGVDIRENAARRARRPIGSRP